MFDLKKTEILKFWNMQLYWINIEGILWWSGIVIFLLNKLRLDFGLYIFCFLMYISAINCCVIILKVYVYKKHKKSPQEFYSHDSIIIYLRLWGNSFYNSTKGTKEYSHGNNGSELY